MSEEEFGDEQQEIVDEFLAEGRELVQDAEPMLLDLEADAAESGNIDAERMNAIFRAFHSLKGSAGFLEFANLVALTHQAESLLDALRKEQLALRPSQVTRLCEALDFASKLLDRIEQSGSDQGTEKETERLVQALARELESGDNPEEEPAASQESEPKPDSAPARESASSTHTSIRVTVEKLDALMNLVGELVSTETMVTHNPDLAGQRLENFRKAALDLNRVTRGLQDVAMSVRMVPVEGVFRKMTRVVRDLAQKQDKQVRLVTAGEDTEVDKNIAEAIADPLVHMIRNAVDHGVESPAEREAAGKEPTGELKLEASHVGSDISITLRDDGKGLDRDAILAKARDRGLVDPDVEDLRDADVYRLLMEPGFSTAAQVTNVSGRGVGMDVVRRNVESLGGRIDMGSETGLGTTVSLRIPLTLAIIDGMLIRVDDAICTMPLLGIRESVRARCDQVSVLPEGGEVVNLRGDFVPVLRLPVAASNDRSIEDSILVVFESQAGLRGLLVDELLGEAQTVIKPLPGYLGGVRGVSGCSILNNGEISLILDPEALAQPVPVNVRAGAAA